MSDLTHPHVEAVRAYLDNAGITPTTLRYAATHEALCRSFIFDLLIGLADTLDADEGCDHPTEHVTSDGLRWPLTCDTCRYLANAPAEDNHPTTDTQQGERA